MHIEIGSIVKTISTNGLVEAGKLLEFTDSQLVLELLDGSTSVTLNPRQNIVRIVIASEKVLQVLEKQVYIDQAKNESQEVCNLPNVIKEQSNSHLITESFVEKDDNISEIEFITPSLRAKNLAELHKLAAEEERKIYSDSLKSNNFISCPEVTFGTPDFSKSFSQHPKKKAR